MADARKGIEYDQVCAWLEAKVDGTAALYVFDLSDREFYIALSWWKATCIVEGVYARMQMGATGGMKTGPLRQVAGIDETYLEQSRAVAEWF